MKNTAGTPHEGARQQPTVRRRRGFAPGAQPFGGFARAAASALAIGLFPACAATGSPGIRTLPSHFSSAIGTTVSQTAGGSTQALAALRHSAPRAALAIYAEPLQDSAEGLTSNSSTQQRPSPRFDVPLLTDSAATNSQWEFGLDGFAVDGISFASADIDGGSGDASVMRHGAEIAVEAEHSSSLEFELGVSYLNEDWSYGGAGLGLVPGAARPWKGFEKTGVELGMTRDFGKRWTLFAQVGYEDAAEIDVSTSDAGLFEGVLAFNKQYTDDFGLRFGLFYGDNHEESGDIIPLIGFDWRITDKDRLSLDRPRTGYGLTYTRSVTDALALSTFFTTSGENYRLANDGPLPGGAIESDEFLFGASVDWQTGPGVLSAYGGLTMGRDYTIFSSNGTLVNETSLDDSAFVGISYQIGM